MMINQTNNFSNLNFDDGELILIDKPSGWTSFDVVNKIRHTLKVKKVGHAGTLDPLATGLLIVATGKITKSLNHYQNLNKTYTGTILLGKTSESMDMETELIDHQIPDSINSELIYSVRDKFIGEAEQITPIFSAAKVGGKRLYKFARSGEKIEKPARKIFIEKFDITRISMPEIDFEITCSKGTYIRAIANDFGNKLYCGGVLKSLRRTKIGDLNVNDAFEINDFIKKVSSDEIFSTQV